MSEDNDDFSEFNFKDLDEMIAKFFGKLSNPKVNRHSISYRFGTGMDKPEIRVNGEKVDQEDMKNFIGQMGPNIKIKPTRVSFGTQDGITELDVKDVEIPENPDPLKAEFEDTYFEIEHDGDARLVTVELPGVDKDQILVSQKGSTVTVIGKNEFTSYKAEFQLDFNYRNIEIDGKNSIYQIRLTK